MRNPRQEREGGVILILTLFVLLISYALVAQLTLGTAVAWQTTKNASARVRMEYACRSAAEEIFQMLKDDVGMEPGGDASEALEGDLAAAAADQGLDVNSDAESATDEEETAADTAASDSTRDAWWTPARYTYGDIEVTSRVEDENGKFNLHLLLQEDEEARAEAEATFIRIVDALRDKFDDDLDDYDANRILEQLREWMDGEKRSEENFPRAFRYSDAEESERVLLFCLEELMLLQDVTESLYYDQVRPENRIAPGLESAFTVYTLPALDAEGSELEQDTAEEANGGAATAEDTFAAEASTDPAPEEEAAQDLEENAALGGLDDVLEGDPPLGVLINLNTASSAVIQGVASREVLPLYMVEQILRYRNEVDEAAQEEADGEDMDSNDIDLRRSLYREDESIPMRFFSTLEDLAEVESWEDRMDEEAQAAFTERIGLKSDIFSIYLFAHIAPEDWEQKDWYEEPPGPVLRLRTLVWRRAGENGGKLITLLPWHEVPNRRWRIPDFQDDLPFFEPPEW